MEPLPLMPQKLPLAHWPLLASAGTTVETPSQLAIRVMGAPPEFTLPPPKLIAPLDKKLRLPSAWTLPASVMSAPAYKFRLSGALLDPVIEAPAWMLMLPSALSVKVRAPVPLVEI
ncbi:hypothetical protein GALL_530560 [mine drainage metagenome]|uniref:Uncharacterized protein n=1 Tax=mine drainage metagenome TaxID=410659 RepID=A0A1J5P2U7_9ZZZZ